MNPLLVPLHLGWSRDVTLKKPSGQVEKTYFYFLSALLAILIYYPRYRHAHLENSAGLTFSTSK
jgi:hypothetical protein